MQKLTLSVDARVVERAKRYARAHGTSVSQLVQKMLDIASAPAPADAEAPPVLSRLRGSLSRGTRRDYHAYLERKYR